MINIFHLINMGCDCSVVSVAMFSLWHQINTLTCLTEHALTVMSSWLNVMLYLLKLQLLLLFVVTLVGQWISMVYPDHLKLRRTRSCVVLASVGQLLQGRMLQNKVCLWTRRVYSGKLHKGFDVTLDGEEFHCVHSENFALCHKT